MEILDRLKLSRRHALRGMLSGVSVAMWLPVLDIMCNENGTAFAQGTPDAADAKSGGTEVADKLKAPAAR